MDILPFLKAHATSENCQLSTPAVIFHLHLKIAFFFSAVEMPRDQSLKPLPNTGAEQLY